VGAGHRTLLGAVVLAAVAVPLVPAVAEAAGPSNTSAPTLSGAPTAESTLTASPGQWSGATSFAYLFQRCNDTLTVCAATGPNALAQNPGAEREDTPAPLWQSYGATPPPPASSSPPAISGTLAVGSTVTLSPGAWSGAPAFTYRIERCGPSTAACAGTAVPNDLLDLGGSTVDPAFETTIEPWVGYGGVTLSHDGAHGKSGNRSLKLAGDGTAAPAGLRLPSAWLVDGNNGDAYAFSAWVYSAAPRSVRIGLDQFESKGGPSVGALSAIQYHRARGGRSSASRPRPRRRRTS
jgi:hypothetical protein